MAVSITVKFNKSFTGKKMRSFMEATQRETLVAFWNPFIIIAQIFSSSEYRYSKYCKRKLCAMDIPLPGHMELSSSR